MSNADPVSPLPETPEPQPGPGIPSKDERNLAMIGHLLGLLVFSSIPVANVIGPLVLWLIKKDQSPFLDDQGKEALNFQIAVTLAILVSSPFICLFGIGIAMIVVVLVLDVVYIVIAAKKSNIGEVYRYPYTIRLIN